MSSPRRDGLAKVYLVEEAYEMSTSAESRDNVPDGVKAVEMPAATA